jgi:hypothetical protein
MSTQGVSQENHGNEIDPGHLAEVTRAVLPYLGTYSITAVKRASKDCKDLDTLCDAIAGQIGEAGMRQRFTEVAARLVQRLKNPAGFVHSAPAAGQVNTKTTGGRPATPITPELMQIAERALAHVIGPLASVLVSRYARSAENSRQFFELLAGHIRIPEDRETFFATIRSKTAE